MEFPQLAKKLFGELIKKQIKLLSDGTIWRIQIEEVSYLH